MTSFDIFVSYSSHDRSHAKALVDALRARRLPKADRLVRVWWDEERIDDFADIAQEIRDGVRASRVLVAIASPHHVASRPCRSELVEALAAGLSTHLVLIDPDVAKSYQAGERALRAATWISDDELPGVVDKLIERAANAPDPARRFGTVAHGLPGTAGQRFTGRWGDVLWLHSVLLGPMAALDEGRTTPSRRAVLHGAPGMGKSHVAIYFAEQFAGNYPLGVLWLDAGGDAIRSKPSDVAVTERVRDSMARTALDWLVSRRRARALETPALPAGPGDAWDTVRRLINEELLSAGPLAAEGSQQGPLLLLVVDDVPDALPLTAVEDLLPISASIAVLATTQDSEVAGRSGWAGTHLQELPVEDSRALLSRAFRGSATRPEVSLIDQLVEAVGCYPLALDLIASRIQEGELLGSLLAEVKTGGDDYLDAADPGMPSGHRASILAAISGTLRSAARQHHDEVLHLAAVMVMLPEGEQLPSDLEAVVAPNATSAVVRRLTARSLLRNPSIEGSGRSMHRVIRQVVAYAWERERPPFDQYQPDRAQLARQVGTWYGKQAEGLTQSETLRAAHLFEVQCGLLDPIEGLSPAEATMLGQAYLGRARAVYRVPKYNSADDYAQALAWVDRADGLMCGPGSSPMEVLEDSRRLALRVILRLGACSPSAAPDMTDDLRLRELLDILSLGEGVLASRRFLLDRADDLVDGPASAGFVEDFIARALVNLTEIGLDLAIHLARMGAARTDVAAQLSRVDEWNAEAIDIRNRIWPKAVRNREQREAAASNSETAALSALLRATFLADSVDARLALLGSALEFGHASLFGRLENDVDVTKSARTLCWAAAGLICVRTNSWNEIEGFMPENGRRASGERSLADSDFQRRREANAGESKRWHEAKNQLLQTAKEAKRDRDLAHLWQVLGAAARVLIVADAMEIGGEDLDSLREALLGSNGYLRRLLSY